MTTYHVAISLDYLINRGGAAEFAGKLKFQGSDEWADEDDILCCAEILKAQGFEFIPPCDHHDARGLCCGHEKDAAA